MNPSKWRVRSVGSLWLVFPPLVTHWLGAAAFLTWSEALAYANKHAKGGR